MNYDLNSFICFKGIFTMIRNLYAKRQLQLMENGTSFESFESFDTGDSSGSNMAEQQGASFDSTQGKRSPDKYT